MSVPFLDHVKLNPTAPLSRKSFPGNLRFTRDLDLKFEVPVTFFVGENGSGKSTLLEAMAAVSGLPISGGGTNEAGANYAFAEQSVLADSIRIAFARRPRDQYFFRADTQAHFASLLDDRKNDPDFTGDPYQRYGGQSLHQMSHGEAFLSVMKNRIGNGLYFMDEPESALSPQRQLTLLAVMYDLVHRQGSQIIIATHSPILLTFPGAAIISFDSGALRRISLEETTHYQITSGILNRPESYWRYLRESADSSEPA